ncbi:MAG: energy transducer TonB [Afipia sp.]|uniref:Protein TonB n=1 Tax=Afipia massiliensis TaxID=211460 RepID=A0A840MTX6_9BRAD|nr:energy transducer TonB [Afipia massiliensis]MBB5051839.1 protein TonB [Afipia massiliensis]MCR6736098.1 energy transducer TonB [Afipia sp.]
MRPLATDDSADLTPASTFARLILFPAFVGILFIGGVAWLRLELAAAGGTPEQIPLVQVHLMPRLDSLSIPVDSEQQSLAIATPSPVRGITEAPSSISDRTLTRFPAEESAPPSDPPMPSAGLKDIPDPIQDDAKTTFRTELARHIARFQRYPKGAERQHLQGTVRAVFSINRAGKLLGVRVKGSSGQSVLDHAALETIRRAQPLPRIPPALSDTLNVEVTLGFDPS